jgi:hypothetical protein
MTFRTLLTVAALLSFSVALLHVVMIFIGAEAYRYFDAGKKMVEAAKADSVLPTIVTLGITVVFVIFGLYALSGAGLITPFPWLQPTLWLVGGILTLRGLAIFVQLVMLLQGKNGLHLAPRDLVFSLVSLCIGIVYLVGTWKRTEV